MGRGKENEANDRTARMLGRKSTYRVFGKEGLVAAIKQVQLWIEELGK
jgi:hypothetical protein